MWPFSTLGKKKVTGQCYICIRSDGIAFVYSPTPDMPCQIVERISYDSKDQRSEKLTKFVSARDFSKLDCSCVLLPEDYNLLQLKKPKVSDDEIVSAARWLIKDLINFSVEIAAIDVFYAPPRSNQQEKINVVAAKLSYLKEIRKLVTEARMHLVKIDISELAFNQLVSRMPESDRGVVFLYAGEACSHIIISFEKTLYVEREISFDCMAEENRSDTGDHACFEPLILEIQRSLDFFQSQFGKSSPIKLYFGPAFNQIPSMASILSNGLTLPVEPLDLNSIIKCEKSLDPQLQAYCLPAICEALGNDFGEKPNAK